MINSNHIYQKKVTLCMLIRILMSNTKIKSKLPVEELHINYQEMVQYLAMNGEYLVTLQEIIARQSQWKSRDMTIE